MSEQEELLRQLGETWEKISASLEKINTQSPAPAAPPVGIEAQATPEPARQSRFMSADEKLQLAAELRKRSNNELFRIFAAQATKRNTGVPVDSWLAQGGAPLQARYGDLGGQLDPDVVKLLDTNYGGALIREDLEPVLYEMYIRTFPVFDMFPKEPANGLIHSYNRQLTFGDAVFMPELGTVTDDKASYERASTPIAILATRRGVSLKNQFATTASGTWDPAQLELQAGLRAIAFRMQQQIFSGHSTDSGGTSANELGLYDPNAFTGLRSILNTSRAVNVDPTDTAPDGDMNGAIETASINIMQAAGSGPVTAFMHPFDKNVIDRQQDKNVFYINNLTDVAVGVRTNAINTVFGATPLFPVPGEAISTYTAEVGGASVRDIYLLDFSSMSLPWLGSEGPTVLDIPVGVSGQLTRMFIIFGMWGLAVKVPQFNNKVRVEQHA